MSSWRAFILPYGQTMAVLNEGHDGGKKRVWLTKNAGRAASARTEFPNLLGRIIALLSRRIAARRVRQRLFPPLAPGGDGAAGGGV